jgi:hypothetical protein
VGCMIALAEVFSMSEIGTNSIQRTSWKRAGMITDAALELSRGARRLLWPFPAENYPNLASGIVMAVLNDSNAVLPSQSRGSG